MRSSDVSEGTRRGDLRLGIADDLRQLSFAAAFLGLCLAACGLSTPAGALQASASGAETEQAAETDEPPSGLALYEQHCASCHERVGGTSKTPSRSTLAKLNVAHLVFSMANGSMKTHAKDLNLAQQIELAMALASEAPPYKTPEGAACSVAQATPGAASDSGASLASPVSIDLTQRVSRWGLNHRGSSAVDKGLSQITSRNVGSLELAWAFGLPDAVDARSQPVVTADTLFLAATTGHLFALDRKTGCTKWHRRTPSQPRTALSLSWMKASVTTESDQSVTKPRGILLYGDIEGYVNAVDALTGEPVWRTVTRVGEHSLLTGSPIPYKDRIIVPISLYEVSLARDPAYECCKTHGAVAALSIDDGSIQWTTELTEAASVQGTTSAGTRIFGPSGVPVWSTPTIDVERGLAYVGTGQNASPPATELSDSVLALDLDSGRIVWQWQALAGDIYNDGCSSFPPTANCPKQRGPDFDIGASVVIHALPDGRERLLVGQKSGDVYALDPAKKGKMLWQRRVGSGSVLGGIHWGLAAQGDVVVAPVADAPYPIPGYQPKPGIVALDVRTGKIRWQVAAERGCETNIMAYFTRAELYPECSFYYGFSAAPTIVNDVVLSATLDGRLFAFSLSEGEKLWEENTVRSFTSVNGVSAHGGSIDVAPPLAVGKMVYVQSGYSPFGQLPGNVLLAYRLAEE